MTTHKNQRPAVTGRTIALGLYAAAAVVVWTAVAVALVVWATVEQDQASSDAARIQARACFETDVVLRKWVADHGGVYVPIDEATTPNPHLMNPERDLTTPSGRKLTLMNPAYMTRQIHELRWRTTDIQGHLTSLKPLRPENQPDAWEAAALASFDLGEREASEQTEIEGRPYLRIMRPLMVEPTCLKCHGEQGYKVGDVRGGLSVAVPMVPFQAAAGQHLTTVLSSFAVLWLAGLGGITIGVSRLASRVRERAEAQAALEVANGRLEEMAATDTLTGLWNRRRLFEMAQHEFNRSRRQKAPLAALMLDIDHFKAVNDTHGHQSGDRVLAEVAKCLKDAMRAADIVARYGGEEFVVLMPDAGLIDGVACAERIRESIANLVVSDGKDSAHVTVSVGAADSVGGGATTPEELLRQADAAMYAAKAAGRNCVCTWQEMAGRNAAPAAAHANTAPLN
jgi:diguanylate cyclase (GGDEF)-like protein